MFICIYQDKPKRNLLAKTINVDYIESIVLEYRDLNGGREYCIRLYCRDVDFETPVTSERLCKTDDLEAVKRVWVALHENLARGRGVITINEDGSIDFLDLSGNP